MSDDLLLKDSAKTATTKPISAILAKILILVEKLSTNLKENLKIVEKKSIIEESRSNFSTFLKEFAVFVEKTDAFFYKNRRKP